MVRREESPVDEIVNTAKKLEDMGGFFSNPM